MDKAAAPADNPATETILGFSGDVTEISKGPSWVAKCLQGVNGHAQM